MKKLGILLLAGLLLWSLCACGGSPQTTQTEQSLATEDASNSAYDEASPSSVESPEGQWLGLPRADHGQGDGTKLIYRGELTLETTQFDQAQTSLDELVAELDGYYQERSVSGVGSGYRSGWYTVRIPAEAFDQFCDRTGQLCHLVSAYATTTDISETYYDTEGRLATQKTKLERLQDLLSKASSMEDIIALESALSETEQAIDDLSGSLRWYDSQIDYASVSVSIQEVYQLSSQDQRATGFGDKLGTALADGLRSAGRGLEALLLGLAYNWILVLVLIVAAIFGRRAWKKHRISLPKSLTKKEDKTDDDPGKPTDG